uniref:Uncharacterized protein n=1 Tax=Caenorhabditis japonica TaxID=281687 RepID=A0A8R1HMU1_CAEJA
MKEKRPNLQPGANPYSNVVANNQTVYVVNGVQKIDYGDRKLYDPYLLSLVLGFLYEKSMYGEFGPPGGFTMGRYVRKRRSVLVFTRKAEKKLIKKV